MQTCCPQCGTQFRVTEAQINTADGYVRCGICEEIFNVYEVAEHTPPQQEQQDHQQPSLNNVQADTLAVDAVGDTSNDAFDFFTRDSDDLTGHVVPEEFRESHFSHSHSTASTIFWGTGIVVLTASLILQYAWYNRNNLIHIAEIQAEVAKLCQTFDCKNISLRAPSKIELVSRNVYSHPNEKQILLVNVTMKNTANFSQPYPVMSINFSDIRGNTVAARHFFPDEYLPTEYQQNTGNPQQLLPPDSSTTITMEIRDPGKQALTYEFNFL